MISAIRRSFGKKSIQVIMWITLISLTGLSSLIGLFKRFSGMSSDTVAQVAGYDISLIDFKRKSQEEERKLAYYKQQFGTYAPFLLQSMGISTNPHENALQALLQERLLLHAADLLHIDIAHEYVMNKIHDPGFALQVFGDLIPPQIYDALGGLDTKLLLRYVQRQGLSINAFEKELEDSLRRFLVIEFLRSTVYVPHAMVKMRYIKEFVGRTYGIASFAIASYKKKAQEETITHDQIESYFTQKNSQFKKYWTDEKRSGRVWIFEPDHYGIVLQDDAIAQVYKRHQSKFIDRDAEVTIRRIILKNENEAQKLAQELAQYPMRFSQKAEKKSEVVTRTSGQDEALKAAAFALTHDGATSSVIKTDKGFEIIGRVHRTEATYKPLSEVKQAVIQLLLAEKFAEQFARDAQNMISAHDTQFMHYTEDKHAQFKEVHDKEQKSDTDKDAIIIDLLFTASPGKRAYKVANGKGYIIALDTITPRAQPALKAVEQQVRSDIIEDRAQELMNQAITAMTMQLKAGKSLKELCTQLSIPYRTVHLHDKKDPLWEQLMHEALPTHRMMNMVHSGAMLEEHAAGRGYVVSLLNLDPYDQSPEKFALLARESAQQEAQQLGYTFIASLQKNATIKINNSLISAHMTQ